MRLYDENHAGCSTKIRKNNCSNDSIYVWNTATLTPFQPPLFGATVLCQSHGVLSSCIYRRRLSDPVLEEQLSKISGLRPIKTEVSQTSSYTHTCLHSSQRSTHEPSLEVKGEAVPGVTAAGKTVR